MGHKHAFVAVNFTPGPASCVFMVVRNQTILLVDDEVTERKRMRTVLRNAGYSVIEARDYAEGSALYQRRRDEIDMLLIDVSLPGNNGCVLAKDALAMDPGVKVVLMS